MKCPYCEKEIDESEQFCPHCDGFLKSAEQKQKTQSTKQCFYCRHTIPANASFCPNCGRQKSTNSQNAFDRLHATPTTSSTASAPQASSKVFSIIMQVCLGLAIIFMFLPHMKSDFAEKWSGWDITFGCDYTYEGTSFELFEFSFMNLLAPLFASASAICLFYYRKNESYTYLWAAIAMAVAASILFFLGEEFAQLNSLAYDLYKSQGIDLKDYTELAFGGILSGICSLGAAVCGFIQNSQDN